MRGAKSADGRISYTTLSDWPWTNVEYELELPIKLKQIDSVRINPLERMADVDSDNNELKASSKKRKK